MDDKNGQIAYYPEFSWRYSLKDIVSKIRTKKTKTREKQACRAPSERQPLHKRPIAGFFIVFLLWLATAGLLCFQRMMENPSWSLELTLQLASDVTFLLISLFAIGVFMEAVNPGFTRKNSKILLISLVSLVSIIPAGAIFYMAGRVTLIQHDVAIFLIPFAMAPMLATILTNRRIGIAAGVWTSLVTAFIVGRSFPLFITGMIVTVLTSQGIHRVRTRTKVLKIGLAAGLAEIPCVFAITSLKGVDADIILILNQASACVVSGFLSAIIVLLILPFFETLFHITTDITLLELSDMGHPLLERLAIEAPGTYHHSLVVANLAQAAAGEIGANTLRTRVCSYFHDIGKLTKPDFFTENIQLQANPHDDLPPSMSTLVIIAHVKEGLSLAMHYKLPDPVIQVIQEHHGTSLLSYFHHKAVSQMEFALTHEVAPATNGQAKINEADFRYPGPKPISRESAIICLADAVEAASRCMEKITPPHIEGLVNEIINTRQIDGQLDNCHLTLADLTKIKRSFVISLLNMFHTRISYPKDENRDKQQTKTSQGE